MKIERIKKLNQLKLNGITIEGKMESTQVKELTLTDSDGNVISLLADYGVAIFVKEPPAEIEVFQVTCKIAGEEIIKTYESEVDAMNFVQGIEDKCDSPPTTETITKLEE